VPKTVQICLDILMIWVFEWLILQVKNCLVDLIGAIYSVNLFNIKLTVVFRTKQC